MTQIEMPAVRPAHPFFSSGPCKKRPGWSVAALADACVGRSHRSPLAKAKIAQLLDRTRSILEIPSTHRIGILPASDTGAVEAALWSLLGQRGVDVLAWESFGNGWATDIRWQLKLADARILSADFGALPELSLVDPRRDVVFTWNGTTSGVRVPNGDWIARDRAGLTICDATSAVFAMSLPWDKLDVVTWSWQKVLGGEAQHGMLALSPRAVERLETYSPPWPLPKIFRLTEGGRLNEAIFRGDTINTPSMLCVEDQLDALAWAQGIGGLDGLVRRADDNLAAVADWVAESNWIDFLAARAAYRSSTSVCLKISDPWFTALPDKARAATAKAVATRLEAMNIAYDIGAYREAPPGLRIWCGATVETTDLQALLPWLDWAYAEVKTAAPAAA